MSQKVTPSTPGGFPEYLPEYQLEHDKIKSIIAETYARHGFTPLDTPDLEKTPILLAKGGGETDKQVYSVADKPLSMRFDLTVPLARYTAEHQSSLVFPFKRYHIGKVHRGERSQAGRFHEFYQCDIDIIGTTSPLADAEIPALIHEIFTKLDFGKFLIRINDRRIISGFFGLIGIPEDKYTDTLHALDKIEKLSESEFTAMLEHIGLSSKQTEQILTFTKITGDSNAEIIQTLESYGTTNALFNEGLASLKTVITAVRALGVPEQNFRTDTRIARGLDYYTGTVYETILTEHRELGSVCSGGRYDDLAEHYTTTKLPGVGISIGLTRLFYALKELGIIQPTQKSPADVIVIPIAESDFAYAAEVASAIRASGTAAMLYTELGKLSKKLTYANKMGFSSAAIVGETEQKERTVSLKNMHTGDSTKIPYGLISTSL